MRITLRVPAPAGSLALQIGQLPYAWPAPVPAPVAAAALHTTAAQCAHRHRWPQGRHAYVAAASRHTAQVPEAEARRLRWRPTAALPVPPTVLTPLPAASPAPPVSAPAPAVALAPPAAPWVVGLPGTSACCCCR